MNSKYFLRFRRQRNKKTNYKKRLALLKSGNPRAVIRKNKRGCMMQIIEYEPKGDKVLVCASSNELKNYGWKANSGNLPAAYLTGYLCGLKAKKLKLGRVIADIGIQTKQKSTKIFSALKGLKDAGIDLPINDKMFPSPERVKGEHIKKFAKDGEKNFSKKKDISKKITKHFEKVKKEIEEKVK